MCSNGSTSTPSTHIGIRLKGGFSTVEKKTLEDLMFCAVQAITTTYKMEVGPKPFVFGLKEKSSVRR